VRVLCELVALHESPSAPPADPSLIAPRATDDHAGDTGADTDTEAPTDPAEPVAVTDEPETAPSGDPEAEAPDGDWPSNGLEWPAPSDEGGDDNSGPAGPEDLPDRRLLRGWHT
jgi:hypothetical protein